MGGGAIGRACEALVPRFVAIGAHLMQCATATARYEDGRVVGPQSSVSLEDVAAAWYMRPDRLPPDVDLGGLEATIAYKPDVDTGAFSYASHAAVVAVHIQLRPAAIPAFADVRGCGSAVDPLGCD